MRRDPRCPLADVDRAATDIARFTEGMDADARFANRIVQAAVERKFEIIGEALNRLHRDHPDVAKRIPGLRKIVDFRNLSIHACDRTDPKLIWACTGSQLPELHRTVRALLAEPGPLEG